MNYLDDRREHAKFRDMVPLVTSLFDSHSLPTRAVARLCCC